MWLSTSTSIDPSGNGSAVPSPQTNATRSPNRSAARRSPGTSMSIPRVRLAPAAASSSAMNPAEQPMSATVSPPSGPWKCSSTAMIFAALRRRFSSSSIADWSSEWASCATRCFPTPPYSTRDRCNQPSTGLWYRARHCEPPVSGCSMAFLNMIRGEFVDIIEWLDDSRDTIVWRFPRHDNEIKMGAKLIVRESLVAVFVNEGQIADACPPGTFTLQTRNMPILSTLKGWKYGFDSPFKAEVYFVSTRQFTDFK